MKIFISGGTGFIGTYVVEKLKESHSLIIISRNDKFPDADIFNNVGIITYQQLKENPNLMDSIDVLIHMAAVRPNKLIPKDSFETYNQNLLVAQELFQLASLHGVKKIIHLSSKAVYGQLNPVPHSEDQIPKSDSLYGLSKILTEETLSFYSQKYGFKAANLRLAQVLGWGEKNKNILSICLDNALNKQKQIVFGKGVSERSYVYVKDVADVVEQFVLNQSEGTFNVAWQQPYSNLEIVQTINEVFENDQIEFREVQNEDLAYESMNTKKIAEILNRTPQFASLKEALTDMKSDYLKDHK